MPNRVNRQSASRIRTQPIPVCPSTRHYDAVVVSLLSNLVMCSSVMRSSAVPTSALRGHR